MGKYTHMHAVEVQHAKRWHDEEGMSVEQTDMWVRRVALTLPTSFVEKAVQSMKRRCKAIKASKGYLIEE